LGVVCYGDSVRAELQNAADGAGIAVKVIARPNWYL
jgi:hypothetical protein